MQNIAISYFFTVTTYWSSTRNTCCYSICLFYYYSICLLCWYNIHSNYNFITLSHWNISNILQILPILTNTCAMILTIIFLAFSIIFTFTLTCVIIPFHFSFELHVAILNLQFKITWNMFCHCFSLIFVCYVSLFLFVICHICLLFLFWNTYF